ncbi:DNA photolyase family protein, partial [Alphaproteobacteria bacterium]|nr:DNA photolyase family protein [Alphaproteobacteria bacterium]
SFKASLLNEPWTIKNKSNSFFKVFTPYWNKCLDEIMPITLHSPPKKIKTLKLNTSKISSLEELQLYPLNKDWVKKLSLNWYPGEKQAIKSFDYFKNNSISNYDLGRDRPDKNYTSKLSPYLHFGEISPERIFLETNQLKTKNISSKKKFISEIGWREFSHSLLYYYPDIKTDPIQKKFEKFPWKKNSRFLKAWQNGCTGYPIVDAGMRQLYQTGWMHNRVRMIVGSFLCKNLLIHWVEGEKWFFDKLVDADLASNSAGWQWIAGCGADAAPYFRVFNPVTQGLKFDSNGDYVKKYLPELKNIPFNLVHSPWNLNSDDQKKYKCVIGKDYPKPIVNLKESRNMALSAFSSLKENK